MNKVLLNFRILLLLLLCIYRVLVMDCFAYAYCYFFVLLYIEKERARERERERERERARERERERERESNLCSYFVQAIINIWSFVWLMILVNLFLYSEYKFVSWFPTRNKLPFFKISIYALGLILLIWVLFWQHYELMGCWFWDIGMGYE